jgi:chemotaxis protein histidine kinase CheA
MASTTSALDFFILEASGYIDGLDALLGSAGPTGPDREAFVRLTRALRGNAVMYRQQGVTTVASALEGCARAVREGRLAWGPAVQAVLTGTIDDLRILVRNVRQWSGADDQRANARAAELEQLVPRAPTPSTAVQAATDAGGRAYLGIKTRELGATLARVSAQPGDASVRAALEHDIRVLSGVALLKEYPVLARVVASVERETAALSAGAPSEETRARLRRVANALGGAAAALEAGDADRAERGLRDIAGELEGAGEGGAAERIVAIDELFYADGGPTVVEPSAAPPTSAAERFRIEVVGLAEHARRVIADVRGAPDDSERDRGWRALERAFGSLVETARSFGESAVAGALGAWERAVAKREAESLDSLDRAAEALSDPAMPASTLEHRLQRLGDRPDTRDAGLAATDTAPAGEHPQSAPLAQPADASRESAETPGPAHPPAPQPAAAARASTPRPPRSAKPTPTGIELREMLQSGITELGQLDERPLTAPIPLAQERVVPIETLLYRGDAALERARAIRDEIRASGGTPSAENLDELFALLDLVRAE